MVPGQPGLHQTQEPLQRGRALRRRRASGTSRSRAPPSAGAFRSPTTPSMWSTSGSTPSPTTFPPSASAATTHRLREILAGAGPPRRQGHPAFPLRLLACIPDVRRSPAAEDDLRSRLVDAGRGQDVEVAGQRRPSRLPDRPVRRRRPALLPGPRDGLRSGCVVFGRRFSRTLQCRPRERTRQYGVAGSLDDLSIPRRRRSRPGRRRPDPEQRRRPPSAATDPIWRRWSPTVPSRRRGSSCPPSTASSRNSQPWALAKAGETRPAQPRRQRCTPLSKVCASPRILDRSVHAHDRSRAASSDRRHRPSGGPRRCHQLGIAA